MKSRFLMGLFAVSCWLAPAAYALPQFSVQAAADCETCHKQPAGWANPAVQDRKCTLSCQGCHVNPTGGGLKSAGGLHYGNRYQPLFGSKFQHRQIEFDEQNKAVNPMIALAGVAVPKPNTSDVFDGINPRPTFQVGLDFRGMLFVPNTGDKNPDDPTDKTRVFPMQADLYAAARILNPEEHNQGRLTAVGSFGAVGQRYRGEDFAEKIDKAMRVKESYLLYDDLPYNLHVKAGRFIPAFGWKLDDHTAYIRQEQTFDNERWVEGVEVGVNPNYPYLVGSLYYIDPDKFTFLMDDKDKGYGGTLSVGTRHLGWQLGASALYEDRKLNDDLMLGVNWGMNFFQARHPWKEANFAPLVYLGELDFQSSRPQSVKAQKRDALTMFHEIDYFIRAGLRVMARLDWQDFNLDTDNTHRTRATFGLVANVLPYTEVIAQYRRNGGYADAIYAPNKKSELILQLHLWY